MRREGHTGPSSWIPVCVGNTTGVTTCTPNESEVEQALGVRIDDDFGRSNARDGDAERTRMDALLVTRGSRGMALFDPSKPTVHIPIFGSDEIAT